MVLSEFMEEFRRLHEGAKRGVLGAQEVASYQSARDDLARVLLAAMHASAPPGQRPRRMLRVARALQVDIEFLGGTVRAVTRQVSSGGFGALLGCEPRVDDELRVALRVPGGQPVHAAARVREVKRQ